MDAEDAENGSSGTGNLDGGTEKVEKMEPAFKTVRKYRYGAPVCRATKEGRRCTVEDCKRAHPPRCLAQECYPRWKDGCTGWKDCALWMPPSCRP